MGMYRLLKSDGLFPEVKHYIWEKEVMSHSWGFGGLPDFSGFDLSKFDKNQYTDRSWLWEDKKIAGSPV